MLRPATCISILCLFLGCTEHPGTATEGIRLVRLAEIGGPEDDFAWAPIVSRRLLDGGFVAVTQSGDNLPRQYDAGGRRVREIGRRGSGPNEYQFVSYALVTGDSVILFDRRNARASVLLDGALVRTLPITMNVFDAVEMPDGTFLISISRIGGAPAPAIHLSREGEVLGQVGEDLAISWLVPETDSTFLAAHLYGSCEFTRWTLDGRPLERRTFCHGWYEPYEEPWTPSASHPPLPMLGGFWMSRDTLWLVANVADPRWREGLGPSQTVEGREYNPVRDPALVFDPLLEAYDWRTGQLLRHQRFSEWGRASTSEPRVLHRYGQTDDGFPLITLYQVQ